ncbi:MAG: dTMP kinase [Desulfobacterales bacterium]
MFITLEGVEGAGKSTQLGNIRTFLQERGRTVIVTREPGGTDIGRKIRSILLNPDNQAMEGLTELFLYEADRAEHVRKIIAPALSAGKTVLCDRFCDATVVYQGYARGLDLEEIRRIHRFILGNLRPDLTILLDLPPEIGLARAWAQIDKGDRTGKESRFEKEALDFHRKIRAGYLDIARHESERFCIVDAEQDAAAVCRDIKKAIERLMEGRVR